MLEFMDYVQFAFYNATKWNYENSYSQLTATAKGTCFFLSVYLGSLFSKLVALQLTNIGGIKHFWISKPQAVCDSISRHSALPTSQLRMH